MASRSLGTLTVDLIARIGGFTRGMDEAERKADRTAREIARKQKQLAKQLDDAAKGIGVAFGAAVAGLGVAFAALDSQLKNAAVFKDLEETTGASAEGLASMAVAAETAGVSMDAVAANSIRLTKGLTGVDDESKAAGAAIKALGLNLDEFKKLDPVAQIDALTKAFNSFEDGPEKAAVATALWGKSGAEMLKVLKALEEQGGRTVILTQQQIEAADAYADAQAKAAAELKLYAQVAASQAAPAFLDLTNAASDFIKELIGINRETGKLGESTAVKDFATAAADALAFVVDAGRGVVQVFTALGTSLGAGAAALAAVARGDVRQAIQIAKEGREEIDRILSAESFRQRLEKVRGDRALTDLANQAGLGDLDKLLSANRPKLKFDGAIAGAKSLKKEVDEVAKALADVDEQLALFGQDESFVKAFKLEGLGATNAQLAEYRDKLAQLEQLKTGEEIQKTIDALVKERDEFGLTNEQLAIHRLALQGASSEQITFAKSVIDSANAAREQQQTIEEGKRVFEETRTPLERYEAELAKLNDLLQRGAIDWNTYARALFQAQEKLDETTKKTEQTVDEFTKNFAENTQDFLGQGLYDILQGDFDNIGDSFAKMIQRMVAEAAAADIARTLFGDLLKGGTGSGILGELFSGGSGGGFVSSIASFFGGFFANGGNPPLGKVSVVGEEGPELFVPKQAGTIVPLAKVEPATQNERPVYVNLTQQFAPGTNRQTIDQAAVSAGRALQRATARGTV